MVILIRIVLSRYLGEKTLAPLADDASSPRRHQVYCDVVSSAQQEVGNKGLWIRLLRAVIALTMLFGAIWLQGIDIVDAYDSGPGRRGAR